MLWILSTSIKDCFLNNILSWSFELRFRSRWMRRPKLTCRKHRGLTRLSKCLLCRCFIFSITTAEKKEEVVKRSLITTGEMHLLFLYSTDLKIRGDPFKTGFAYFFHYRSNLQVYFHWRKIQTTLENGYVWLQGVP